MILVMMEVSKRLSSPSALAHDTQKPIRYCKYCGAPIRFESFDEVKILNANSIFHWERKVTRRWIALDFYTGKKHNHRTDEGAA